jgi:hypothetical protein
MRILATIPADATTPAGSTASSVPAANVIEVPRYLSGTDVQPAKYVLACNGANTATVEFWAEIESTQDVEWNQKTIADRAFVLVGAAQAITANALKVVDPATIPPTPGRVYMRITVAGSAGTKVYVGLV